MEQFVPKEVAELTAKGNETDAKLVSTKNKAPLAG